MHLFLRLRKGEDENILIEKTRNSLIKSTFNFCMNISGSIKMIHLRYNSIKLYLIKIWKLGNYDIN